MTVPKLSENSKTQIVTKLKFRQTKTKKNMLLQNSNTQIVAKFVTQIVIKLKFLKFDKTLKLNCNKTQKLFLCQISISQIVITNQMANKLKHENINTINNSNCDKTIKFKL